MSATARHAGPKLVVKASSGRASRSFMKRLRTFVNPPSARGLSSMTPKATWRPVPARDLPYTDWHEPAACSLADSLVDGARGRRYHRVRRRRRRPHLWHDGERIDDRRHYGGNDQLDGDDRDRPDGNSEHYNCVARPDTVDIGAELGAVGRDHLPPDRQDRV